MKNFFRAKPVIQFCLHHSPSSSRSYNVVRKGFVSFGPSLTALYADLPSVLHCYKRKRPHSGLYSLSELHEAHDPALLTQFAFTIGDHSPLPRTAIPYCGLRLFLRHRFYLCLSYSGCPDWMRGLTLPLPTLYQYDSPL
jgi:hypothetical protein